MKDSTTGEIWHEYYATFPYFDAEHIRPGCHAQTLLHSKRSDKAIVLVHGLSDSPYTTFAIGLFFHQELGYDVYLPLLQGHGLDKETVRPGIRFSLAEWKKNLRYAVEIAGQGGRRVSVGGFSAGGALAFHYAATADDFAGELYLFAAAFGIYGGRNALLSSFVEKSLRALPRFSARGRLLVGKNPCRYSRIPLPAARELAFLMKENKKLLQRIEKEDSFSQNIFSAWSERDRVIRVDLLRGFSEIFSQGQFVFFAIPAKALVRHTEFVLAEPIYAVDSTPGEPPVEIANPLFAEMMQAISDFENSARPTS